MASLRQGIADFGGDFLHRKSHVEVMKPWIGRFKPFWRDLIDNDTA